MFRPLYWVVAAASLAACAALGPRINLSLQEIADRAFFDRRGVLGQVLRAVDIDIGRPDVAILPGSQRLQLGWTLGLRQAGVPLSVRIAISGRPELNAQRTGIDLADSRLEELRVPSVPLLNLADRFRVGDSLGRLPLLTFTPEELQRAGTMHQVTGVALTPLGLGVDLSPR